MVRACLILQRFTLLCFTDVAVLQVEGKTLRQQKKIINYSLYFGTRLTTVVWKQTHSVPKGMPALCSLRGHPAICWLSWEGNPSLSGPHPRSFPSQDASGRRRAPYAVSHIRPNLCDWNPLAVSEEVQATAPSQGLMKPHLKVTFTMSFQLKIFFTTRQLPLQYQTRPNAGPEKSQLLVID